jgi:hypothetical protein
MQPFSAPRWASRVVHTRFGDVGSPASIALRFDASSVLGRLTIMLDYVTSYLKSSTTPGQAGMFCGR